MGSMGQGSESYSWQFKPGQKVKGFIIEEPIADGGMGEVYLAREITLNRLVALKVIKKSADLSPMAIKRFLREAVNTAKAPHPNIVVVYSSGKIRHEGAILPYVALEYLENGDLNTRIVAKDLGKIEDVLGYGCEIAAALCTAHNAGIHHRDLKPANLVLDRQMRLRVVDFGLAKAIRGPNQSKKSGSPTDQSIEQEEQNHISGTPPYMAPEQWTGQRTGSFTDVWALGVVLYEMTTYELPFTGHSYLEYKQKICGSAEVDYSLMKGAPEALEELVKDCLKRVPKDRPSTASVLSRLEEIRQGKPRIVGAEGPFRGLLSFEEHHEQLFFGRDEEIERFTHLMSEFNILTLMGPSGTGKSSLVKAGLLPRLRKTENPCVVTMRPGHQPLEVLAEELFRRMQETDVTAPSISMEQGEDGNAENNPGDLARALRKDPAKLAQVMLQLAEDCGQPVVLFIDQLEEVVTLVEEEADCHAFLASLGAIATLNNPRVRVIQTVRDGFVGPLMQENIGGDPLGQVEVVKPPGKHKLMEVLLRPVEEMDYTFEDEALAREMVEEVAGGAACLPLLQFAGQRLWDGKDRKSRLLLRSVYEDAGGVAGMLANYAESVVPRSKEKDYRLARDLLLQLVTSKRTKRTRSETKLLAGMDPHAVVILRRLVEGRLITVKQGQQGEREYELIHESLISNWELLSGWIDLHDEDLLNLRGLTRGAETWKAEGRPGARLLWGKPLTAALAWRARCKLTVPPLVEDFLLASRRRWRSMWFLVGITVLIVIAGLGIMAYKYAMEAEAAQAASKLAESRRIEAVRQRAAVQREGARAALVRGDMLQARGQLRASMETGLSLPDRSIWWELGRTSQIWRRDLGANPHDLAFLPGGKTIAAASQDGTVQFIDATTSLVTEVVRDHTDQVLTLAVSSDGRYLASADWSGLIQLRDLKSGAVKALRGHRAEVWSLVFAPDCHRLVSAGYDKVVRIWSVPSGTLEATLPGHEHFVRALAFTSDGKRLLSAGLDNMIRVWDMASKQQLEPARKDGLRILTIAISPDDKQVAAGGAGKGVWIWDLSEAGELSSEPRRAPFSTQDAVRRLRFGPHGKLLAATGWDGSVKVWNQRQSDLPRQLGSHGKRAPGLAFSPDGKTLATSGIDHTVRLWDVRPRGELPSGFGHTDGVITGAIDPSGKTLASGGEDGTVRIWNVESGVELRVIKSNGGTVTSVDFSPDGKLLATGSGDYAVRLWDPSSGMMKKVLLGHSASVRCVRFSPDGRYLGSTSSDRTVRIWDVATGAEVHTFEQHKSAVMALAFSPNGSLWASGDAEGLISIWDISRRRHLRNIKGHDRGVSGLAFGPHGKQLVSGSWDGSVKTWTVETGQGRELASRPARVYRLDLSPDGALAGVPYSDGIAVLIPTSGGVRRVLRGHGAEVNALRFSTDGKQAVTASDDGTVRVWDVETGRPAWRSTLTLASGETPQVLSHRGWTRPGNLEPEAAQPGEKKWRIALQQRAQSASESPSGASVCFINNGDHIERWDVVGDQQIFSEQEEAPLEVMALEGGCLVRTEKSTRLYDGVGAAKDLGILSSAFSRDGEGFLVVGKGSIRLMTAAGVLRQAVKVGPHAVVVMRLKQQLVLGYRDGSVELVSMAGNDAQSKRRLRGTFSSRVAQLAVGLPGTIIAGFANGRWGIWDEVSGRRLLQGRLHGPVGTLLLKGTTLSLVTKLGHSATLDLGEFKRKECDILQDTWRRVPVIWENGEPHVKPAPLGHRCTAAGPAKGRR